MKQENGKRAMTAGLRRTMVIFVLDLLCIAGSFFLALWMRFEFRLGAIPQMYLNEYLKIIGPWIVICLVVFQLFRLYNSIWSFVSIDELFRIILAYGVLLAAGLAYVLILKIDMPRSFYFAGFIMSFMSTTALRFSYRFMRQLMAGISTEKSERDRILMIGAGEAGRQLIREINSNPRLGSRVVCIIDDNPSKRRRYLDGVEIAGGRQEIPDAVKKYQVNKIIFAIPTCDGQDRKEILDICSKTGCRVQAVPGMFQLVNGEVSVSKLRDVELQDLLGRDPIQVNLEEICRYISGKVVMVTGGGGSIGSELCRQIAKSNPEQLIIFDIYENNAYDIQMELRRKLADLGFYETQTIKLIASESADGTIAQVKDAGLAVPVPQESQEICFIPAGEDAYRAFLERRWQAEGLSLPGSGPVLLEEADSNGRPVLRPLARHEGLWRYTEGQRRGLGIAHSEPLYVLRKQGEDNTLVVGGRARLGMHGCLTGPANLLCPPEQWPDTLLARLRHRQRPTPARVEIMDGGLRITLAEPQFPSAPGQVAAIYDEQGRVLAGALVRELF